MPQRLVALRKDRLRVARDLCKRAGQGSSALLVPLRHRQRLSDLGSDDITKLIIGKVGPVRRDVPPGGRIRVSRRLRGRPRARPRGSSSRRTRRVRRLRDGTPHARRIPGRRRSGSIGAKHAPHRRLRFGRSGANIEQAPILDGWRSTLPCRRRFGSDIQHASDG